MKLNYYRKSIRNCPKKFVWTLVLCWVFVTQFAFAQEKTISGNITDQKGEPLPGVNIVVKGTARGVQSDFYGNYSIKADVGTTLVFRYLGQQTVERSVGASSTLHVQMQEDTQALEEVVVVGYGSEKKSNVTGAISSVKAKTIENVPIPSIDQVLQGQVAGLNVNTGSGQPGQSGTIIVRGRSSFNSSANLEPLFIIDGVRVNEDNFRSLNANDIADISVLKDAAAAALYGNRAAGGVIIVTTKKGDFNSPLTVTYRSQYGISTRPDPNFEVMNALELLTYEREIIGAGLGATVSEEEAEALARQTNTNWSDIFFKKGKTLRHEVVLSGGGAKTRTYNSMSYFEQEGITFRTGLKAFSLRSNIDTRSDRFNFASNITVNFSRSDFTVDALRGLNTGGELDNPFLVPYLGLPYQSPYNPDGSLNTVGDGSNGFLNTPYIALNTLKLNTDREDEIKAIINLKGSYELVKNISVGTSFGLDYQNYTNLDIVHPTSIRGSITPSPDSEIKGARTDFNVQNTRITFTNSITYSNVFNDAHSMEGSVFVEYVKRHLRTSGFTGFGLHPGLSGSLRGIIDGNITEEVDGEDTHPYIANVSGSARDLGLFSIFGLVKYDYKNRYGIQASIRRDASSRFTDTNEWGTFWSISGRWNINNESFMAKATWLDELKLRLSYGILGNEAIGFGEGNVFPTLNLFALGNGYAGTPGIFPATLGNPDLRWEEQKSANIGLDFGFLQNRLSGSLELYQIDTEDILSPAPISLTSGFGSINRNLGAVRNKGVELSVSYDIIRNKNLIWNIYGNTAYNKNEILTTDGEEGVRINGEITALSIGTFYLVRWAGVNPANGEPLYLDADGNITNNYSLDNRVVLTDKTRDPKFHGGFGTNISYKGFSLSSLFSYTTDVWRDNGSLGLIEDPSVVGIANQSTSMLRAWSQPGDITDIPSVNFSTRLNLDDRYLEDASFLRLRNITLGYTLPGSKIDQVLKSIRFYIQGQNLFTWTKWSGFDPESNTAGDFFDYPVPKTYTFGIDINF